MRLGGKLSASIEVLEQVESRHRPISEALKDWGVAHRFAGSGDRAAIGNIVYDAMRWRASSAWVMGADTPRAVVLATIARRWEMGVAGVEKAVSGDPHAPEPLTDDERSRLETADLGSAPDHVRADIPGWAAARFERVFGAEWVAEGEALALRPPLDMRANRVKADRARVRDALAKFGALATPYSPDGVRIPATAGDGRHPNVQVEPAFQKGWFEVQDEGSQIAALMVGAKAGQQVLDLCAGAGGKTLALASMTAGKGRVVATDSDRVRLAPIFERVKRADAHSVEVREAGAALDDLGGKMDAVLIDAPCTGSGVWRRRPDSKWKLTERALGNRLGEQAALLSVAAQYVKPGGRLVYVTCSLLPEENADQIAAFAASSPAFRVVPPAEALATSEIAPGLADAALFTANGIVLSPRRTGTDGFFVAVLQRT
jgi:16S rRNA (cytosine967-C5)-methyltransferase